MTSFPVLSAKDQPFYPADGDGRCPHCKGEIKIGEFAYIGAGALLLSPDGQDSIYTDRLQAFLNVGFHSSDPDMKGSANISVIDDLQGGQFDLQWCTIRCMREWFDSLFQQVEMMANVNTDNP